MGAGLSFCSSCYWAAAFPAPRLEPVRPPAFVTNAGNAFMGAARVHTASAFSGATAALHRSARHFHVCPRSPSRAFEQVEGSRISLPHPWLHRPLHGEAFRPFLRQRNDHQGLRHLQQRHDRQHPHCRTARRSSSSFTAPSAAFWCAMSMSRRSGWPSNCAQLSSASSTATAAISTPSLPICATEFKPAPREKCAGSASEPCHQEFQDKPWPTRRDRRQQIARASPRPADQDRAAARRADKINNALHAIEDMIIGRVPDIEASAMGLQQSVVFIWRPDHLARSCRVSESLAQGPVSAVSRISRWLGSSRLSGICSASTPPAFKPLSRRSKTET